MTGDASVLTTGNTCFNGDEHPRTSGLRAPGSRDARQERQQ